MSLWSAYLPFLWRCYHIDCFCIVHDISGLLLESQNCGKEEITADF